VRVSGRREGGLIATLLPRGISWQPFADRASYRFDA
jgi:hypothetical protein